MQLDMDLDLYDIIKKVPADNYNNEEILKEAEAALRDALVQ